MTTTIERPNDNECSSCLARAGSCDVRRQRRRQRRLARRGVDAPPVVST